ncbi:MAG: hypothetical protein ABS54_13155 [Hyphomicrobium sp. SCN 65-11]|nr:MAG: hypothetical protein ABS54_13155 [Hyphomicrobium sp. SCN 65-11]
MNGPSKATARCTAAPQRKLEARHGWPDPGSTDVMRAGQVSAGALSDDREIFVRTRSDHTATAMNAA